MAFKLLQNWAKWRVGDEISGGEIKAYHGEEQISEVERRKLGLAEPSQITDARIDELVQRGVLLGIGDDARVLTLAPEELLINERLQAVRDFNKTPFKGRQL